MFTAMPGMPLDWPYSSMSVLIVTITRLLSAASSFWPGSSLPVLRHVAYPDLVTVRSAPDLGRVLYSYTNTPCASVLPTSFPAALTIASATGAPFSVAVIVTYRVAARSASKAYTSTVPDLGSFMTNLPFQGLIRYPGISLETTTSTSTPGFFFMIFEKIPSVPVRPCSSLSTITLA